MNFFNWIGSGLQDLGLRFNWRLGVPKNSVEQDYLDSAEGVVYTCCKILADNVSRLPIEIKHRDDSGTVKSKDHYLWDILRNTPNGYQSPQVFLSTLEYQRSFYGNAFAYIHRNKASGEIQRFEIIHPNSVKNAKIVEGVLYYIIEMEVDGVSTERNVKSDDILHFRSVSGNGIFGISPIYAMKHDLNVIDQAGKTITNFYKNNATSTMALKSSIGDSRNYQALKQAQTDFVETNGGADNAGKIITLPPNTELIKVASNYADAQLIETLKLKNKDILAAYQIPEFLFGDVKSIDIENMSLTFRLYTIAPILAIYESEFVFKLLTTKEKRSGFYIAFDTDSLISSDFVSKVTAISTLVKNGLISPNEALLKLGNKKIDGEFGDYHMMQMQYIPLEKYQQYGLDNGITIGEKNTKEEPKPIDKDKKDGDET